MTARIPLTVLADISLDLLVSRLLALIQLRTAIDFVRLAFTRLITPQAPARPFYAGCLENALYELALPLPQLYFSCILRNLVVF